MRAGSRPSLAWVLAWVMWSIPSFVSLVAFFHRVAPGTVAKELMASFQADLGVAVVNPGSFLGAALTQTPVGALLHSRWARAIASGARAYPREAYCLCALLACGAALPAQWVKETRGENIYPFGA